MVKFATFYIIFLATVNICNGANNKNALISIAEKHCSIEKLDNEWVSVDNDCKKKPLSNLVEDNIIMIKSDMEKDILKKQRILKDINNQNPNSSFTFRCREFNRTYLKIREAECKLNLPMSLKYE